MEKKRVLVVEDEKSLHDVLKAFIGFISKGKGIDSEIDVVASSDEAFEKIRALVDQGLAYDILLTDKDCPVVDTGLCVMRHIKKYMPEAKSILMSGNLSNEAVIMGEQCGAVEFLAKPFTLEIFKRRVGKFI
jgi:CheY-like chemotaxis protein